MGSAPSQVPCRHRAPAGATSHRAEVRLYEVQLNIDDVLNTNSAVGVTAFSEANFMRPIGIVPPRILEFGASYVPSSDSAWSVCRAVGLAARSLWKRTIDRRPRCG